MPRRGRSRQENTGPASLAGGRGQDRQSLPTTWSHPQSSNPSCRHINSWCVLTTAQPFAGVLPDGNLALMRSI
jgi:hypothetical protein